MNNQHRDRIRPTVELLENRWLLSATYFVSTGGNDASSGVDAGHAWRHIQKALVAATPGTTVNVAAGLYNEKVVCRVSGSATAGAITFQASGNVIIDGTGLRGKNMVDLSNSNYVNFIGFEITNDLNVRDGSGIRVEGTGDHLKLQNNVIHHIMGKDAMGITIYGESATSAISNLVIDGNSIYDCQPAQSEALTLNGNVTNFRVTNNSVSDVNNIGIDFIGGEGTCPNARYDLARNGMVMGNHVTRARSNYGGGYAAGIYVDGGQGITIANNTVTQSDLGIEVGCEHAGRMATGITVRDNLVFENDKAGIVFGGYDRSVGRVSQCQFSNNTLYHNDTTGDGNGELWIQFATRCLIENNLIYSTDEDLMINEEAGGTANTANYNLFFTPDGSAAATFNWHGVQYDGLAHYRAASGQDAGSVFADPLFVNPAGGNFHLLSTSPAINAGVSAFVVGRSEVDIDLGPRLLGGRIDIGVDEVR